MNKQDDLFDRVGAIQPGNRQIDLEQIIEEKRKMFDFETTEYVCADCGGKEWHANRFFCNSLKQWQSDDIAQWCSDCETEVSIIPADEYEAEEE